MKAKELKDEKYFPHAVNGEVISEGYLFSEEEMSIFWSQLCKEQREIIFNEVYNTKPPKGTHSVGIKPYFQEMSQLEFRDAVLNAPEPEID